MSRNAVRHTFFRRLQPPQREELTVEASWSDVRVRLNDRSYAEPAFLEEIKKLSEFVSNIWEGPHTVLMRVLRRIGRTRRGISAIVEPGLDEAGHAETLLFSLAGSTYSLILFRAGLLDPNAKYLMYQDGTSDPAAEIPSPESAQKRRERTSKALAAYGIALPDTLPSFQRF